MSTEGVLVVYRDEGRMRLHELMKIWSSEMTLAVLTMLVGSKVSVCRGLCVCVGGGVAVYLKILY